MTARNRSASAAHVSRCRCRQASSALCAAGIGSGPLPRAAGFQAPNARPRIGVVGSRWGCTLAPTLILLCASTAVALVNPQLQPSHLIERHRAVVGCTVAAVLEAAHGSER
jgi:hypothetical protein